MKKNKKIKIYYTSKQVCKKDIEKKSFSKSPLKPLLLMRYLKDNGFGQILDVESDFKPFTKDDFYLAHTEEYVNDFYNGEGLCESNSIPWSKKLVKSVGYTNSSLYNAIKYACENPDTMTFSPTSGFHHAMPESGCGFCTFSGQVITSLKLYEEKGLVGAYLDLDGHFGNSIPDSVMMFPEVNKAIAMNINPKYSHKSYIQNFKLSLKKLEEAIKNGEVDYVVWCHGADSHEWDDLGYQCSTREWLLCSELFYGMIAALEQELGKFIPVTATLFGGYRSDDYESVLSLHTSDLKIAASVLLGVDIEYKTSVLPKIKRNKLVSSIDESTSDKITRA